MKPHDEMTRIDHDGSATRDGNNRPLTRLRSAKRHLAFGLTAMILALSCQASVRAQDEASNDQIWIAPARPTTSQSDWYPQSIRSRVGRVVAVDEKRVRFLAEGDEAETIFASDRLIWVTPGNRSANESAALKMVTEGKHAESVRALLDVLKERPPVWRQQWLSIVAADAAWKSERATISLEIVAQIDRRPLPAMVLARLPIQWQNRRPGPQAESAALSRIADSSPLVQLVSASWLLSSRHRNQAAAVIEQLRASKRATVARFAEVLSWRTATPELVAEKSREWRTKVASLPMALQSGPTRTLIDKFRAADMQNEAAILQWSLDLTPIEPKF